MKITKKSLCIENISIDHCPWALKRETEKLANQTPKIDIHERVCPTLVLNRGGHRRERASTGGFRGLLAYHASEPNRTLRSCALDENDGAVPLLNKHPDGPAICAVGGRESVNARN